MDKNSDVIWPRSVRLIHWSIALIVLLDAFGLEEGDPPHRYLGYLGVGLVLMRVLQGVTGSGWVRFSNMPLRPRDFIFFFKNHFKGKAHFEGHNPLASVVYLLIWSLVIGLAVTGWMFGLDAFWGSETLEEVHSQMSDALIALVIIHLCGVVLDAMIYRRKTWMGMFNGKKK